MYIGYVVKISLQISNKFHKIMSADKVAVVTGANKGLGFAIVRGICKNYSGTVYLTSRNVVRGKQACEELEKLGLQANYHQLDITDGDTISIFCSYIQEKHEKIDILVNNAGILFLKDAKESRIFQAEQTILVNFTALVNFCEAMLPLLRDGGTIVNISSSSGHLSRIPSEELRKRISSPNLCLNELKKLMNDYVEAVRGDRDVEEGWGDSAYVVSKVGVNAYTFMLHRRLENRGIKVNCVHPGYMMSDMTRGAGSVTPEEGAQHPLRLALSPPGSGLYIWSTGNPVPWDGPDPRGYIDGRRLI